MTLLWKRWAAIGGLLVALVLCWLASTDDPRVWPVRNTLQYHFAKGWWSIIGAPSSGSAASARGTVATVTGVVRDAHGRPVQGARVLLVAWDGTSYGSLTGPTGQYLIPAIPAGMYAAVVGKPEYDSLVLDNAWLPRWLWQPVQRIQVRSSGVNGVDVTLKADASPVVVRPGTHLIVGAPQLVESEVPIPARAWRRQVSFDTGGRANQLTLLYTPTTADVAASLPVLLTVYPGPADQWESASVPLAAAGYAVIAVGPAYSFAVEQDVDELAQLVQFARADKLPNADGSRIGVLGGSYSGLHVQRLLQRDLAVRAAVLMGAPTDLFDMRRRLEDGTFVPPFGLDQALIALGFPDREPLRYWRYSGAYHVRSLMPPMLLIHSRSDDVVPYQQSMLLAEELTRVGVPHELHLLDGGSHYLISNEGDARLIHGLTLGFLVSHLR